MARKDNSPAISFFSFQDIITSVTGIMFLVMLMLTLLLLLREPTRPTPEREAVNRLQEQVQALQARIAQIVSGSADMQERLKELQKLDPTTIPQRIADAKALLVRLDEEMARLAEEEAQTRTTTAQLVSQAEEVRAVDAPVKAELQQAQADLSSKEKDLRDLQASAEKSKSMMRFTWNGSISQKPLLVECSSEAIIVGAMGTDQPQKIFRNASASKNAMQFQSEFLAWAKQQPASGVYFVFLAKPSAFSYVDDLADVLGENGYTRGREVLPNDDVHVFAMPQAGGKP